MTDEATDWFTVYTLDRFDPIVMIWYGLSEHVGLPDVADDDPAQDIPLPYEGWAITYHCGTKRPSSFGLKQQDEDQYHYEIASIGQGDELALLMLAFQKRDNFTADEPMHLRLWCTSESFRLALTMTFSMALP